MNIADINKAIDMMGNREFGPGDLPYLMQQQVVATLEVAFQIARMNQNLAGRLEDIVRSQTE